MKDLQARARGRLQAARRNRSRLLLMGAACTLALAGFSTGALAASRPGSGGGGVSGTTRAAVTTSASTQTPAPPVIPPGAAAIPFRGRGMWIWVLASSNRGNLSSIIAQAHKYGISTLFIKSGDGTNVWSQFNATLVTALHAAGLRVCAWQYVYGTHPQLEAQVGAQAVADGADCLLIDAESEYEGRYVQAQIYMNTLRKLVGASFPVGLAGFPYVDYHPSFPYSVFLGPGGAQYNVPQMYWKDIGTTVDAVYAHTYEFNEIYQRPIAPLGQIYDRPPLRQVRRFRAIARSYRAQGLSWWDWQSATRAQFKATAQPVGSIRGYVARTTVASLGKGAVGDVVVWAQEHLVSAGEKIAIDGDFGPKTRAAVENFQAAQGLPVTGLVDAYTWAALLRYPPVAVKWVMRKHHLKATTARGGAEVLPVPKSASRPARGNELHGAPGRGRPQR